MKDVIKMSQLYIDDEAKSLIKRTQVVVYNNNKVTLDLKDLVYLAFKRPEIVAKIINKNFAIEMDEKFKKKIQELRNAVKDDDFLNDLREISEDFADTDMEGWPEDEI
jgi:prephenate dehydrogenase